MKSALRLVPVLVLCACIGCAGGAPELRQPTAGPVAALDVLKLRQPSTKWYRKSLLKADLDQDGTEDYALLGRDEDRFVVGIVHGPADARSGEVWTLDFPWHGGEDALCSQRAKIALESLAENEGPHEDQPRTGQGINLSDDLCDAFHIYWNPRKKRFDWWRL